MSNGEGTQIKTVAWIKEAIGLVKGDLVTFAITGLLVVIPILNFFMLYSLYDACRRKVQGEKPQIGDAFKVFSTALVPALILTIITWVAMMVGSILCGIGVLVTGPIVMFGFLFAIDKKMEPIPAIMASKDHVMKSLVGWIIFFLLTSLVISIPMVIVMVVIQVLTMVLAAVLGPLALLVMLLGLLIYFALMMVLLPVFAMTVTLAYRDTVGFGGAAPAAPAAPAA